MTQEEKLNRGKQILSDMKSVVNNYYAKLNDNLATRRPRHFEYYTNILHAVSPLTHDKPIPLKTMYLALAEAEEQGKKVYIVPDKEFLYIDEFGFEVCTGICDGWSYHLVID